MDIDLLKVIGYSRNSLQSRALMRSIMLDLYPDKTREMNVLLDVYESGVPRNIKKDGNITDAKYAQYVQKIIDDYGMQEQWAVSGLNSWIDVCLGKGIVSTIHYKSGMDQQKPVDYRDNGHNPIFRPPVNAYRANPLDYEIKTGTSGLVISKFVGIDEADTVIPNEIDGQKVIGIGENAFKACKGIVRLAIPEGIEFISNGAFSGCTQLKEVIFPSTFSYFPHKKVWKPQ